MSSNLSEIGGPCKFCSPWYDPTPLVSTSRLFVKIIVKDDMFRYVLVKRRTWRKWREVALEPIDKCPICGKEV